MPRPCVRRSLLRAVAAASVSLGIGTFSGCMLAPGSIEPSPLSAVEQQIEILDLAPVGTPRDEAIRRLETAGIEGGFGASGAKSTYYCDLWNRPDGTRWHLDVAVLFDDDGRVWIARSAAPDTHTTAVN